MKKQYPYSNDKEFLSKLDELHIREQWVKITLLEYNSEIPLEDIEGKVVSGTLSKDGNSAVRRTCNLSCTVDAFKYDPDNIRSNYSISKKIYLELGITNSTNDYSNEKVIWFPQGVFFITSIAISSSATGAITINLEFKDKMARLDGTLGGKLPATVRFDTVTSIIDNNIVTKKALVYDIIMEAVNHFGGEDLSNIIIDDIPTKAKRIIRWVGTEPIWIYPIKDNITEEISYDICFTSDLNEKQSAYQAVIKDGQYIGAKEYKPNQDIGYMYEDFVYDDELTFNAGSKVTDVLDKLKNWLGNYEYFYDEQGQFHFQEIKNYLNNSQTTSIWDRIMTETDDSNYLYESIHGKTVYTFDDNINLISITNTPVYENIKNDFIVEGTVTNDNIKHVCRYHLVIDDKPAITMDGYDNVLIYTDPVSKNTTLAKPIIIDPIQNEMDETDIDEEEKYIWALPEFAEDGKIYGLLDEPQTLTFKRPLKDMDDFATEYNKFVNQENALITAEQNNTTNSFINENKTYLLSLLENYMGYADDTPYKTQYHDIIITLARQLQRYNITEQIPQLSTTLEYYNDLYAQYNSDITTYGEAIQDKISWCGGLLQLLYDLFANIETAPNEDYKDTNYWPSIDTSLNQLWINMSINPEYPNALRLWRKGRCTEYIDIARVKQRQLNVLIEQYIQIVNNYNVTISLAERNGDDTDLIIAARERVQNQINNYKEQLNSCNERLTILYAVLTALNAPDENIGEIYYDIDISIPVYVTSFWYYNANNNSDNYGWSQLEWYQYYHDHTNPTEWYPYGLGPMTYIDYSKINWEDIEYNNNVRPSMNRYSPWYQNQYIQYAKDYDLSYIDIDQWQNKYIPHNWRTELLLRGMRAEENGTDPGYYYQELKANWPSIYDFKTEQLAASSIDYIDYFVGKTGVIINNDNKYSFSNEDNKKKFTTTDGDNAKFKIKEEAEITNLSLNYENDCYYYYFDMIDSSSPTWGEYSVNNIGRRTNVNVNDGVNCIFAPKIPDYAFINVSGLTTQERRDTYAELSDIAEDIIQVTDVFYKNFATGGFKYSAYEQIKYDLQQYTSYQNTVSITAIPCFYLEPNTRVRLNNYTANTYGDYIIKSISIPLGGNSMSVSLSKAMEKI